MCGALKHAGPQRLQPGGSWQQPCSRHQPALRAQVTVNLTIMPAWQWPGTGQANLRGGVWEAQQAGVGKQDGSQRGTLLHMLHSSGR